MITILGWIAAAGLLVAYGLLTTERLAATSITYLLLNLGGSIGLGLSTAVAHAWPSTAVNVIWLGLGIMPLAHALARARSRTAAGSSAGQIAATAPR